MPPDLNEVARPLAVPSPQICGGIISASLPPRTTDENNVNRDDKASGGEVLQSNSQSLATRAGNGIGEAKMAMHASTSVTSKFYLTPALRTTFEAVGATAKAYTFKEILGLLKAYLYSNRHLFDTQDTLYVNCGNDSLGEVFKVDRFHYNDVRSLIAKHVIQEQVKPVEIVGCDAQVSGASVNGSDSNFTRHFSGNDVNHGRTSSSVSVNAYNNNNVNPFPYTNGKTYFGANTGVTNLQNPGVDSTSSVQSHSSEVENQGPSSSVSGPSSRPRYQSFTSLSVKIPLPAIPEGISDSESVYSCQGYETALCRNTEFEDTEESAESEFEEYELASDDDDQEQEHSDDNDSVIEDVEVALLAMHALDEDELEEDFWADDSDDSDVEEQSTDDDPELSSERWDCLTCGIKNKPFVRYCGKCWQLRKNWLPERPKKKRRKPRPKKKMRRRTNSVQSCTSATDYKGNESTRQEEAAQDSGQEGSELLRTCSTATTVSIQSELGGGFSSEQFSSQDSGICLSQENLTESSQDIGMEDFEVKPSCSKEVIGKSSSSSSSSSTSTTVELKPSCSKEVSEFSCNIPSETSLKSIKQPSGVRSSPDSSRKRKSTSKDDSRAKRSKTSYSIEFSDGESSETTNAESGTAEFWEFLKSEEGNKWIQSVDVNDFRKALDEAKLSDSGGESSPMCVICCLRPKNAVITHGRLSHQATCYQCARRLLDTGARCPVCRRKIHMVCKNIIV